MGTREGMRTEGSLDSAIQIQEHKAGFVLPGHTALQEAFHLQQLHAYPSPGPSPQDTISAQSATELYLAGPLWAAGSHIKWSGTLYATSHRATWVGTRPSRLQASGLHDPGLHGPGFKHSWLQDPWLHAPWLQAPRLHHPGLQPSWLQSSRLQPSGISSNCRGRTRQAVEGSSAMGLRE